MKDKTLKILLGIIAVNLTIQTVKDVDLFPTAYAQDDYCFDASQTIINHDRLMRRKLDGLSSDLTSARNAIMNQIIIFAN